MNKISRIIFLKNICKFVKLLIKYNLNNKELSTFTRIIDEFLNVWVDLVRMEGMTNYIHILGVGHVTYYLEKYINLIRYY